MGFTTWKRRRDASLDFPEKEAVTNKYSHPTPQRRAQEERQPMRRGFRSKRILNPFAFGRW